MNIAGGNQHKTRSFLKPSLNLTLAACWKKWAACAREAASRPISRPNWFSWQWAKMPNHHTISLWRLNHRRNLLENLDFVQLLALQKMSVLLHDLWPAILSIHFILSQTQPVARLQLFVVELLHLFRQRKDKSHVLQESPAQKAKWTRNCAGPLKSNLPIARSTAVKARCDVSSQMCELRCAVGMPFLDSSKTPYNSGLWCFACRSEFEPIWTQNGSSIPNVWDCVCVWLICCSYAKQKPWHRKWFSALAMLIVWVEICRKRLQISNVANIWNSITFLGAALTNTVEYCNSFVFWNNWQIKSANIQRK